MSDQNIVMELIKSSWDIERCPLVAFPPGAYRNFARFFREKAFVNSRSGQHIGFFYH